MNTDRLTEVMTLICSAQSEVDKIFPFQVCLTIATRNVFFNIELPHPYNVCNGGVEDNADICHHEAQTEVRAIVVVVIMA